MQKVISSSTIEEYGCREENDTWMRLGTRAIVRGERCGTAIIRTCRRLEQESGNGCGAAEKRAGFGCGNT